MRLLNTLLKPSQESLELAEMEQAAVFGKGLLSKVSSGSMQKKLRTKWFWSFKVLTVETNAWDLVFEFFGGDGKT